MFEIPGGHAEDADETILSTVARECVEETGLVVKQIVDEFEGFEYESGKGLTVQLNFVVEVDGQDAVIVKLNPEEHQAFAWVEKEDLEKFQLTDSMRKVVTDALKHA
jgi:8-oxo-dGTP pyrophosphatase MutT (NUDIX family)